MSISAADPRSLKGFATGTTSGDAELADQFVRLRGAYEDFVGSLTFGRFEASAAVQALSSFVADNRLQANQVNLIALLFEKAGGGRKLPRMNDATIETYLDRAGLSEAREHVTYDDPVALGMPATSGYANDPVNAGTGNFVLPEIDLERSGLVLLRVYNSRSGEAGAFGPGWASWATTSLRVRDDGAHYRGPDGQRAVFGRQGDGYGPVLGVDALVEPVADGLEMRWFDGRRWSFDEAGRPALLDDGPGSVVRLTYDESGHLAGLTHQRGRAVRFTWTGDRITAAEIDGGPRIAYGYDEAGVLVRAGERRYTIGPDGRIAEVADADGVTEVVNTYDDDGRVLRQVTPFGRQVRLTYLPGGVTVVDDEQGGPSNTYVHDSWGRLLTLIDGHGSRLSRTYDEWGRCVSVTDRDGAVSTMEWNDRARLTARTSPSGLVTRYRYDAAGRLTEAVQSTGEITRFAYAGAERLPAEIVDPEGGVTHQTVRDGLIGQVVDPDGVVVGYDYDAHGQLSRLVDADGNATVLERDPAGRVSALVRPGGRRDELTYDDHDRLAGWRTATGAIRRFEYSPAGRLTATVDPLGSRDERRYGAHGAVETARDPLGQVTSREYDPCGNLVRLTTADGAKWDFGYDGLNRLVRTTDPAGATWLREYTVTGVLSGLVDPAGVRLEATVGAAGRLSAIGDGLATTTYEHDIHGRVTAATRADGATTGFRYDRCGRRTMTVDAAGGVHRITYTPAGRVRTMTSPGGRTETMEYDRCGRPVARLGSGGRRWGISWDPEGRPVSVTGPDGQVTRYAYDPDGRLSSDGSTTLTYDAAGRVITATGSGGDTRTFEYDALGRLTAAVDPRAGRTRYAWSMLGAPAATTDPLGGVTSRRHDEAGRVIEERDPLGRTRRWAWDAAGRPMSHVDASGRSRRWTYDRAGRVSGVHAADGEPVVVTRDPAGRPIRITGGAGFDHALSWDALDRLTMHRRGGETVAWRYDADGRRTAVVHPDGTETTYRYDEADDLVAVAHPATGEIVIRRDPAGRMTAADAAGMRASWHYTDGLLTDYTVATGTTTSRTELTRDEAGRITSVTVDRRPVRYRYDEAGQLVGAGERSFAYDAGGRLIRDGDVVLSYDAAGQLTARGDVAYEYDDAGRRIRETAGDGSVRAFQWDAFGQLAGIDSPAGRTEVAVDALGDLASVNGRSMMWDLGPAGAPLWVDGAAVVGAGLPWATAKAGPATWLAPDWQGTVGRGRDAWGAPAAGEVSLGYRGEVEFGGLTWLRDRVYDPAGRGFLTTDPLPAIPGTAWAANRYHYAGNDPIGRLDPTGRRPLTDDEFRQYRASTHGFAYDLGRAFNGAMGPAGTALEFAVKHPEIAAGMALIVASLALDATGIGAIGGVPLAEIGSGILFGGGESIIEQKIMDHSVNYAKAGESAAIGGVAGGLAKLLSPVFRAAAGGLPKVAEVAGGTEVADVGAEEVAQAGVKFNQMINGTAEAVSGALERVAGSALESPFGAVSLVNVFDPVSVAADVGAKRLTDLIGKEGSSFARQFAGAAAGRGLKEVVKLGVQPSEDFVEHPSVENFKKMTLLPIIAPLPFPTGLL